jgi:rubredoxin
MPKKSKKRIFRPDNRFIFNSAIQDSNYKEILKNTKISGVPEPYPSELFSSWISRTATHFFMQTPSFVNIYFPEYKNWFFNRDIDIRIDDEIIENFSKRTGIDKNILYKTSLKSYEGYLSEKIYSNTRNSLISTIKIKGTYAKLPGLKYCPLCLKEKEYFRKEWRLAFYPVCVKHKTFLIDRCPNCGEPLTIFKRKHDIESFNCWNCGFIFKEAEPEFVNPKSKGINLIYRLLKILNQGYFKFNNRYYYSMAFFPVVKKFAKLIYLNGKIFNDRLLKEMELNDIIIKYSKAKILEETASIKESYVIFSAVSEILKSEQMIDRFVKENKITYSLLIKDMTYIPYWYQKIVNKYYDKKYSPAYEEVKNAVNWMKKKHFPISFKSVSEVLGYTLERRKRPDLIELIL